MSSQRRDQAIRRFDSSAGQYQDVYQKVGPELICDMLDQCRGAIRPTASQLLEEMARRRWTISATLHEGGIGGGGRGADPSLHFTVRVGNRSYHLQCRENAHVFYIYNITS